MPIHITEVNDKTPFLFKAICIKPFAREGMWPILIPLKIYKFYNDANGYLSVLPDKSNDKDKLILFWINSDKIKNSIDFDEYFLKINE